MRKGPEILFFREALSRSKPDSVESGENPKRELRMKEALDTFSHFDLGCFGYPQEDDWALPKQTMQLVGRLVEVLQPKKVIEFGSGFSTVVIATLIRAYGGQLLSFDHSVKFTRAPEMLRERRLTEVARVALQQITFQHYGAKVLPMYSIRWKDFDEFDGCELALIDGPPGDIGREAVLYEIFPRLVAGGWVIVDDVNRDSDRRWVESWKRVFGDGLEAEIFPEIGLGVGVLRKLREKTAKYRFGWGELYESWRHAANIMEEVRKYE
jgi:predicted O-methyltransferase YrrM